MKSGFFEIQLTLQRRVDKVTEYGHEGTLSRHLEVPRKLPLGCLLLDRQVDHRFPTK
jgi:hypothetical protein